MNDVNKLKKGNNYTRLLHSIAVLESARLMWTATPIMTVWEVCVMLLKPPCTDEDRDNLAKQIIFAIERWGMDIYSYPSGLIDVRMFNALPYSKKIKASIHVDEFVRFASVGKIGVFGFVLASMWRVFIKGNEDRLIDLDSWVWEMLAIDVEIEPKDISEFKKQPIAKIIKLDMSKQHIIDDIEKRVMDAYKEFGSYRKVHRRKILDNKTGKAIGINRIGQIIKKYSD